ncbi:hypothetical protein EVAR_75952_1 [Eumeta japonica]|uniref:Uncharacterized protein n=1 Tax=Eumeta variegata TaxID=151549 RepID=A0A4C1UWC0_EUMVA|nr:hypothetical protein EVAR_75952_1 [Eumeta japonica]
MLENPLVSFTTYVTFESNGVLKGEKHGEQTAADTRRNTSLEEIQCPRPNVGTRVAQKLLYMYKDPIVYSHPRFRRKKCDPCVTTIPETRGSLTSARLIIVWITAQETEKKLQGVTETTWLYRQCLLLLLWCGGYNIQHRQSCILTDDGPADVGSVGQRVRPSAPERGRPVTRPATDTALTSRMRLFAHFALDQLAYLSC